MGIIARQSIKASIVAFVGVGIGAISKLFVFTNFLTPEEIGLLETIAKLGMLLMPFFLLGVPSAIKKYYPTLRDEETDGGLVHAQSILLLFSICVFTFLFFYFKDYIVSKFPLLENFNKYYYLALIVIFSMSFSSLFQTISILRLRITVPNILSQVVNRLGAIIIILIYSYTSILTFDQFILSYHILFFIIPTILLVGYVLTLKFKFKVASIEEIRQIFKVTFGYNLVLILNSLSGNIVQAIDINMISSQLGLEKSGIYSIAMYLGIIVEIPLRNIAAISFPILNEDYQKGDMKRVDKLNKSTAVNQFFVSLFIFSLVIFNLDSIFEIIPNGERYESGKYVVLFIGLSRLVRASIGLNTQIIIISDYYRYFLYINILFSISLIVFNLVFIPLNHPIFGGINGSAFATLLGVIFVTFMNFLIVWIKDRQQPFSVSILKSLIPYILLFLILRFIDCGGSYLDLIIKSLIIVFVFVSSNLYFNISDMLNTYLKNVLQRLF